MLSLRLPLRTVPLFEFLEQVRQYKQDRGGREVADFSQTPPGTIEFTVGQFEDGLHRLQDFGTTWMADPMRDLAYVESEVCQEVINVGA